MLFWDTINQLRALEYITWNGEIIRWTELPEARQVMAAVMRVVVNDAVIIEESEDEEEECETRLAREIYK